MIANQLGQEGTREGILGKNCLLRGSTSASSAAATSLKFGFEYRVCTGEVEAGRLGSLSMACELIERMVAVLTVDRNHTSQKLSPIIIIMTTELKARHSGWKMNDCKY